MVWSLQELEACLREGCERLCQRTQRELLLLRYKGK